MTEQLPSDHPAIEAYRVHLERAGRTSRLRVPLPSALDLGSGEIVRLSLEGDAVHARTDETLQSGLTVDRAADNRRLARTGEGTDRLADWLDARGLAAGDPLIVDELTPGYAYGLRRPGERVVYDAPDAPDGSLSRIAENLE